MKRTWRLWTPEEDAILLEQRAKRASVKVIAVLVKRTQSAVQSRLIELDCRKPRITPGGWKDLLTTTGKTERDIAAELDLTVHYVRKKARQLKRGTL